MSTPPERRTRPILRIVVVWVLSAGTLLLASALLADVHVEDIGAALGAAALIGLVNGLLWPLAIRLLLPITVLTLGLGSLVLNGAVVLLVSALDAGLDVTTLWAGILVAFAVTVVTTAAASLLAIDDDQPYFRNVVKRRARRSAGAIRSDVPGLLLLEIDGLAHAVLHARPARRQRPHARELAARGDPRAGPLGDRLVVADRGVPGRDPARRQRRHARVPVVGEGPQRRDRHQPPARRDGARAPSLERARAALRRRGEPGQHPLGRRALQPADDEHGACSATARAASARTTSPTSPTPTTSRARSRSSCARWRASCGARRSSDASTSARGSTAARATRSCARGRRSSSATCRSRRSSPTSTPDARSSTRRSSPTTRSPTTPGSSAPRRS